MGRVGSLAAGTVLLGRVVVMRCLVLLALLGSGCNGQPPGCDTGPYYRCAGGVVYEGECGGQGSPAAQCAKGCAVEDSYESIAQCPFQLWY